VVVSRESALEGRWAHAHEEDTSAEMVFRPATDPLPPSRGRTSFDLRPDGTFVGSSPGPVDVPEETRGSWSLDGDRLVLRPDDGRSADAWRIVAAESGRLVLRK
jgi:hypothetical protein